MKIPPITKTFQGNTALSLPALALEEGWIYAVIGANGSGKSTFARILAGVIPPDSGPPPLDRRIRVGYMPQKSYAFQMSVLHNVLLNGGDRARALDLLEQFGIGELAGRNARSLSGGEIARMAMARLMPRDYDLLILDEPTAAMDVSATLLAEEALAGYRARTGCTVILVTHSLAQARRTADQVLFLSGGKLVEHGDAVRVLNQPKEHDTRVFLEFYGR